MSKKSYRITYSGDRITRIREVDESEEDTGDVAAILVVVVGIIAAAGWWQSWL